MNNQEIQLTMKSRGIIDFYLPSKIAYHIKILLGSFFITMFFTLIWKGRLVDESFWMLIIINIIQLEIFMWIALKIFTSKEVKPSKSYRNAMLKRLLKFYLIVLIIATAILFTTIFITMSLGNQSFNDVVQHFFRQELRGFLISMLIGISIGSLLFFFMEWNSSLKREQKLREEKLIFQYETLKNQVNPHFLFNSLNTLSSLVAHDADLSEKFIHKLSSIYRYILENRDVDFINLSKEIEFVRDYFFLQKIRDDGKIEMELPQHTLNGYEILPISIQILVENALKHNSATRENPLKIKIKLEDDLVVIQNNLQLKTQVGASSKIGLKNLKERVELVMNRKVFIEPTSDSFVVKIPVKPI
jgi:two-component system LytT family sensor kinase